MHRRRGKINAEKKRSERMNRQRESDSKAEKKTREEMVSMIIPEELESINQMYSWQ